MLLFFSLFPPVWLNNCKTVAGLARRLRFQASAPGPAPSIQTTNASPGAGRHLQGYAQALILSAQLKASTLLTKPFLVFTAVAREDNNIHIEELKAAGQKCKHFSLSAFCRLSQSIMKQSHTPNQTTYRDRVLQS